MIFLALDTNIYREFGLNISSSYDYNNLREFIEIIGGNFYILSTVKEELIDYYKNDIIYDLKSRYIKIQKDILRNPFIGENITFSDIEYYFDKAIKAFESSIIEDKEEYTIDRISTNTLIKFLLQTKRFSKKDNTRDFLIFLTLFSLARENTSIRIVFISKDKIFKENQFFKEYLFENKCSNIDFFDSIASFLKEYGPNFDFITDKFLLKIIPKEEIKDTIYQQQEEIIRGISKIYDIRKKSDLPRLELLSIEDFVIDNFYTFKDLNEERVKIILRIGVKIKAIFSREENVDEVVERLNLLAEKKRKSFLFTETFDESYRPVFDNWISFQYEGIIDEKENQIKDLKLVEFLTIEYPFREIMERLKLYYE